MNTCAFRAHYFLGVGVWIEMLTASGQVTVPGKAYVGAQALELDQGFVKPPLLEEAALAVSRPFDLGPGDVLFVSNRRALHYRGECSVRFTRFPVEYQARAIFVLHQLDEPR